MLKFDPINHLYFEGTNRYPSVTQVISNNLGDVFYKSNEDKKIFGTIGHEILKNYDLNSLKDCPNEYTPYLNSWKDFIKTYNPEFYHIEQPFLNRKYAFAGTPDRVAIIKNHHVIIDIKFGQFNPIYSLQTAGYSQLIPQTKFKRWCIRLTQSKFEIKQYDDALDISIFLNMVNIYHWKKNNNLNKTIKG